MIGTQYYFEGKEHVQIDEVTMSLILKTSGGDMRKAVTYLQSSHQLSGNAPITIDTVLDISGQVTLLALCCIFSLVTMVHT